MNMEYVVNKNIITNTTKKNKSYISTWFICIYFILYPLEYMMSTSTGTILKYLAILIFGFITIDIFKEQKGKIVINKSLVFIVQWSILGFVSYFWAVSIENWGHINLIYLRNTLFLLCISLRNYNDKEYRRIITSTIIGSSILALLILLNPNSVVDNYYMRYSLVTNEGITLDPNYLVGIILPAIVFSLNRGLIYIKIKKIYSCIFFIITIMLLYVVLLSGSRGGFLGVAVSILLLIFNRLKKDKNKIPIFILILSIFFIFPKVIQFLPKQLSDRFSLESLMGKVDNGANRLEIWEYAIEKILQHPILGYGVGSTVSVLGVINGAPRGAHNLFIALSLEFGILGTALFVLFLYSIYKKLFLNKLSCEKYLLIGMLIICFFLDSLTAKFFWSTLEILLIRLNVIPKQSSILNISTKN